MSPTITEVLSALKGVQGRDGQFTALCPAHDDSRQSLSVTQGDDRVLWHCHAGCTQDDVTNAILARLGDAVDMRTITATASLTKTHTATYEYRRADGSLEMYRDRFEWIEHGERQKVVIPRQLDESRRGVPSVPYNLPAVVAAITGKAPIIFVEGEKPADVLNQRGGYVATTTGSATSWKASYAEYFRGARVVLWPDADEPGEKYMAAVARDLASIAADVHVVRFDGKPDGWDAADYFAEGGDDEELVRRLTSAPAYAARVSIMPATSSTVTLDDAAERFRSWLHMPDAMPLYAVLGAIAANYLPGDPVWLGIVAPPSSAKTEILNATSKLPNIHPAATLTPASLLSGTSKRERAAGSKGGLLRQIGDFGILVLKDFTSILSMRPDAKAEILAALREIYDQAWTRHVGTDGGQSLSWSGKLGLLFGCTPALDSHHSVIGAMGERFLLCRLPASGKAQASYALKHAGSGTSTMRRELAEAVAGVFAGSRREPRPLADNERDQLVSLASLAVRIRSTVERDRQSREIEAIHGAEGPARLVLSLERLLAGLDTLNCDRALAMRVVERVAMDSVPPLRRRALDFIQTQAAAVETKAVAQALDLPTNTTRRVLEDLAAYQLVHRDGQGDGKADLWTIGDLS